MKSRRFIFSLAVSIAILWLSAILDIAAPVQVSQMEGSDEYDMLETTGSSYNNEGSSYLSAFSDGKPTAYIGNKLFMDNSNTDTPDNDDSEENTASISSTDTKESAVMSADTYRSALNENDSGTDTVSAVGDTLTPEDNTAESAGTDIATGINVSAGSGSDTDGDEATHVMGESIEELSRFANIGISIANSYVNIRKEPNTKSDILGKLYNGAAAEIIRTEGYWHLVESGSVTGYINTDYLKTGIPDDELMHKYGALSAKVNCDGLNVREKPDIESKKLTVIYQNEKYPIMELLDGWAKVDIKDDKVIGYVKIEYIEVITDFKDAISREEEKELLRLKEEERIKRETAVKYRDKIDYNDEDLKLLSCLVHSEAGNQRYEGKLAVANVVLNRIKSGKYPNTLKDVIYQPGQFAVARSGSLKKQLSKYDDYSTDSQLLSIKAARAALEGANNIGSRLYFHTYSLAVKKGYHKKSNSVKLQDHLFW